MGEGFVEFGVVDSWLQSLIPPFATGDALSALRVMAHKAAVADELDGLRVALDIQHRGLGSLAYTGDSRP